MKIIKPKYKGSKYFSKRMNKMIEVSQENISIIVKDKKSEYYANSKNKSDEQDSSDGEQSDKSSES